MAKALKRGDDPGPRLSKTTPEAIPDFDRLIHERARLGIVSALAANESDRKSTRLNSSHT